MGRGVRAVVQSLQGHEVFDQSLAGAQLGDMFQHLGPQQPFCKICQTPLNGRVSLFSADVDQASESCHGSNIGKAWRWAASEFSKKFGTSQVQIKRGKKFDYRIGPRPWSRGWWLLSLDQLAKGLVSAASATMAVLGDVVLELHGMSIGGSMSSAAVSVRFAEEESEAFQSSMHRALGFHTLDASDIRWVRTSVLLSHVCGFTLPFILLAALSLGCSKIIIVHLCMVIGKLLSHRPLFSGQASCPATSSNFVGL